MKTNRNSVSFSVEKELPKLKVSISKRATIDADLEILSIFEWLSLRSKNNNPFETLRAIMFFIKTVKGADVFLDEAIKIINKPVTLESIRENSDNDYVATVVEIIKETNDMFDFLQECKLDIDEIPSPSKKMVLLDLQEYLQLKSNTSQDKIPNHPSKKDKKDKKQKTKKHLSSVGNAKQNDNGLVDVLIHQYNKHKEDS